MRLNAVALVSVLIFGAAACEKQRPEGVYTASSADPIVNGAMEQARSTLPAFWKAYDSTDGTRDQFMLKVRLETPSGMAEHIWMGVTSREGNVIHGLLANEPAEIPELRLNSPITVTTDKVSDWGYVREGKLYGNFTSRVLLRQMSADDRTTLERTLSATTVEPAVP
jgi:uncharacterized protein YegJ (DUF2314 family)